MKAHGVQERAALTIAGPPVALRSGNVQPIALVVHEFATRALKRGASKALAGRLAIDWSIIES